MPQHIVSFSGKKIGRFNLWGQNLILLFVIFCFQSLILTIFRLVNLFGLWQNNLLSTQNDTLGLALFMGYRFDAKTVCLVILPLFVLSIALLVVHKESLQRFYRRFVFAYTLFTTILLIFIETINYHFFKFYQLQLNVNFFGVFFDDREALAKSIVTDFPIIRILLLLLAVVFLSALVVRFLVKLNYFKLNSRFLTFFPLVFLPLFILGGRGSFSPFPLNKGDRAVSSNPLVNEHVMNGFFALIEAYSEFNRRQFFTNEEMIIRMDGYKSLDEYINDYQSFSDVKLKPDSLFWHVSSGKNAEGFTPPNVILVVMESMGTGYIWPEEQALEHIGALAEELKHCDVFWKAMPGGRLTVNTLESIILGTLDGPISQSKLSQKSFSTSIALPFRRAGYKTAFITGGKLDWRNLGSFFLLQGFDTTEGTEIIQRKKPKATTSEWGVFDEYLFDYVWDRLTNDENPKFFVVLTTTHHTPHVLPHNFPKPHLDISKYSDFLTGDTAMFRKSLETFYYSAHQLGLFLERLRNSHYAENTIVAVTGDHTTRHYISFPQQYHHKNFAVPMFFVIPEKYKPTEPDTSGWVSYRDLNSTLVELALSNATYFSTGFNIYSRRPKNYMAVNANHMAVSKFGIADIENKTISQWSGEGWNAKLLPPTEGVDSILENQMKALRAYVTLKRVAQARELNK